MLSLETKSTQCQNSSVIFALYKNSDNETKIKIVRSEVSNQKCSENQYFTLLESKKNESVPSFIILQNFSK